MIVNYKLEKCVKNSLQFQAKRMCSTSGTCCGICLVTIPELLIKEKTPERTLDGRGGRGAHLSPQRHQEYSYTWNSFHGAPAEHQQRTSDTWKNKKDAHVSRSDGRKENNREQYSGQDLHPWWGTEGEERGPILGEAPLLLERSAVRCWLTKSKMT